MTASSPVLIKGIKTSSGWMEDFSPNLCQTRPPPPSWEKILSGQTDLKWTTKTGTKYPELVTVAKVMIVRQENPSSPTRICVCMVELVKYGLQSSGEKWPLMTTALPGATKKVVIQSYHLYARGPRAKSLMIPSIGVPDFSIELFLNCLKYISIAYMFYFSYFF